ncbi:hypothetical protein HD806DRAFT_550076 [Xylariaceae sp. AK1471]|nr:hypothetical protein HD806DRAFT_550076 [Xylariaceae sp. AK1471]
MEYIKKPQVTFKEADKQAKREMAEAKKEAERNNTTYIEPLPEEPVYRVEEESESDSGPRSIFRRKSTNVGNTTSFRGHHGAGLEKSSTSSVRPRQHLHGDFRSNPTLAASNAFGNECYGLDHDFQTCYDRDDHPSLLVTSTAQSPSSKPGSPAASSPVPRCRSSRYGRLQQGRIASDGSYRTDGTEGTVSNTSPVDSVPRVLSTYSLPKQWYDDQDDENNKKNYGQGPIFSSPCQTSSSSHMDNGSEAVAKKPHKTREDKKRSSRYTFISSEGKQRIRRILPSHKSSHAPLLPPPKAPSDTSNHHHQPTTREQFLSFLLRTVSHVIFRALEYILSHYRAIRPWLILLLFLPLFLALGGLGVVIWLTDLGTKMALQSLWIETHPGPCYRDVPRPVALGDYRGVLEHEGWIVEIGSILNGAAEDVFVRRHGCSSGGKIIGMLESAADAPRAGQMVDPYEGAVRRVKELDKPLVAADPRLFHARADAHSNEGNGNANSHGNALIAVHEAAVARERKWRERQRDTRDDGGKSRDEKMEVLER